MSRSTKKAPAAATRRSEGPPFVGAMLSLAHQTARQRILRALPEHGFTDLNQSLLNVLSYPPPDGVRPTELAERTYMTKQAMNYLLGQLEALGYIERRGERSGDRRLVFLTQRGWRVFEVQWSTMQQLEAEWATILGGKRYDQFMKALRCISVPNTNDGAPPSKVD